VSHKKPLWHPIPFVTCNLLALVLYASWLIEPTRSLWDGLDTQVFYALNGSLVWGEGWQTLWAFANSKTADILVGLTMILFFLVFSFAGRSDQRNQRLTNFGILCAMILLSQDGQLVNLYERIIDVVRPSPSLLLEPVHRLSELVPSIESKDAADNSFPGDHGVVAMIWLAAVWFYAGWRWKIAGMILCVLILLPRMVAGAHWLSDNLVGSATLVLLMAAWILCTPVAHYLQRLGVWILGYIFPAGWSQK
jgi:membrane-associated phospholipid phosphatase